MDEYDIKFVQIGCITAAVIALIITFANIMVNIHDEKMASMGCSQVHTGDRVYWECAKDKQ